MNKNIRGYCSYCKNAIYYSNPYTVGENGSIYHPDCYNQEHTYTDEFGTCQTNEFGEPLDE